MLGRRHLQQNFDLVFLQPSPAGRLDRRPRPAATTLEFAALDRKIDVVAARITGHQLQFGAEDVVEHQREGIGVGTGARAAHHRAAGLHVLPEIDRHGMPYGADADFVVHGAKPVELPPVELCFLIAEQGFRRHTAADIADYRAILRQGVINFIRQNHATGARPVLDDKTRLAGNVASHVARKRSGITIVPTTRAVSHIYCDAFAFEKIGDGIGIGGYRRRRHQRHHDARTGGQCNLLH